MTSPQLQPAARFLPWPYDRESNERIDGFDFSVKIQGVDGLWFDLEDGVHYAVHAESFAQVAQTWRKREVNSEWIEGSFPVSAVRENAQEALVVWVRGYSPADARAYRDKLVDALCQLSFMLMVRRGDVAEYWQCFPSDYTIEQSREFQHAGVSIVRATVPRLPAPMVADATGDEY